MSRYFKELDYFRKAQGDVEGTKTIKGGIVSILAVCLVSLLVCYECYIVFFGKYKTYPFLDNADPETKVRININITFPDIFCKALSVDYQDSTGMHLEDIRTTIHKIRLSRFGIPLNTTESESIKKAESKQFYPGNPFFEVTKKNSKSEENKLFEQKDLSCHGAELHEGQLCFTCSDVLIAFAQRGWPQPMKENISQCNGNQKEAFMLTKKSDGEIEGSTALALQIQQNSGIISFNDNSLVHQVMNQIDYSLVEIMSQEDKELFERMHSELSELQFNLDDTSKRQNEMEIVMKAQEMQQLLQNYQMLKQLSDPNAHKLQIQLENIPDNSLDIAQLSYNKQMIGQLKIYRSLCSTSVDYRISLGVDLQVTTNITQSSLFQTFGDSVIDTNECAHIIPIFISRSSSHPNSIVFTIPGLNIQQQYILNKTEWTFYLEIINPSSSAASTSIVQVNSIVLSQEQEEEEVQENKKEEEEEEKEKGEPETSRRMLSAQNFGHEHQEGFKQFSQQDMMEMQEQMINGEQCQIFGHIYVKKVPGNFHISFHNEGLLTLYTNQIFNLRHFIHTLEFTSEEGKLTLGKLSKASNPLDHSQHDPGHGADNDYYLKVVGTVYENILSGHESIFSFTALESHGIREFRLPSVNFKYEFDPISVLHYRASRSLTSFAVSLCAIIGGALALIKYLHAIWIR